jgi:hypothetical protein
MLIGIYALYVTRKSKNKDFPECLRRGTWGRVVFFLKKMGIYSSPSAWDGALGEEDFLKKSNFFPECCTRGR